MTYLKGKDIKIPFDCLWYYMTRRFVTTGHNHLVNIQPQEFEKW